MPECRGDFLITKIPTKAVIREIPVQFFSKNFPGKKILEAKIVKDFILLGKNFSEKKILSMRHSSLCNIF